MSSQDGARGTTRAELDHLDEVRAIVGDANHLIEAHRATCLPGGDRLHDHTGASRHAGRLEMRANSKTVPTPATAGLPCSPDTPGARRGHRASRRADPAPRGPAPWAGADRRYSPAHRPAPDLGLGRRRGLAVRGPYRPRRISGQGERTSTSRWVARGRVISPPTGRGVIRNSREPASRSIFHADFSGTGVSGRQNVAGGRAQRDLRERIPEPWTLAACRGGLVVEVCSAVEFIAMRRRMVPWSGRMVEADRQDSG